ncbi:hypothetical protein KXQ82_16400 [Mucilaginibacter sp. HMF5004]|uniref:hypothetical protein n=1 Tax=Mucilaginibacter rivuli TaxID=2857527 RepID=UPI001C5DD2B4|nr:hypothetical protein [Mucilaginibacter rivuli]MBW4891310.1 hypothetical protein [Mucilaginibacter rivuli]
MSVLITAANSAQAYKLKSLLSKIENVLLGDYLDIPELMVKSGAMIKTPNPESPSFAHEMLTLCLDNGISMLLPLRKSELLPLAQSRQLFLEFDIQLIIPKTELINRHPNISDGSIVVMNRSEVIAGNREVNHPHELTDGVFSIADSGAYHIFTAD